MRRFGYHDNPVLSVQIPFWRSRLVLVLLFLGFGALIVKALYLQGLSTEFLQQQGERRARPRPAVADHRAGGGVGGAGGKRDQGRERSRVNRKEHPE